MKLAREALWKIYKDLLSRSELGPFLHCSSVQGRRRDPDITTTPDQVGMGQSEAEAVAWCSVGTKCRAPAVGVGPDPGAVSFV